MSDLISRSALIDMLLTENQRCITSTSHELTINMVVSFIKAQPTAYDIEKVVAELEKKRIEVQKMKNDCIALSDMEVCDVENITYDRAIDIVRKGGAE